MKIWGFIVLVVLIVIGISERSFGIVLVGIITCLICWLIDNSEKKKISGVCQSCPAKTQLNKCSKTEICRQKKD